MAGRMCRIILAGLCLTGSAVFSESAQQQAPDYGRAVVQAVIRVDAQCRIYCDIADWPAIIGRDMPVQIRGLEPQQAFDLTVRQYILDMLNAALRKKPVPSDPNQPQVPQVLLTSIQRGQSFCLVADVEVEGRDLGQMLVEKGYAKRLIVPKTSASSEGQAPSADPAAQTPSAQAQEEGFVAAKNGKVFHKPTCPHVRRMKDNTKVTFSKRDDAVASGRRPCLTCNP
ncbi:Ada metal-binding domain-containing protein [Anaerohalosphaeraceae bacterium U12dextr]